MKLRPWHAAWAACGCLLLTPLIADSEDARSPAIPTVRVEIQGDVVKVEAETMVHADQREVWEVLTDFENLPRFVSNIASSKVISRKNNVVRVAQTGKAGFGPFVFEFQSTRELTLEPYGKFESRMVEGNMKRFLGVTRLEDAKGQTRIVYRSEAVPDTVVPLSMVKSTIEAETREHYVEIAREVMRRKAAPK